MVCQTSFPKPRQLDGSGEDGKTMEDVRYWCTGKYVLWSDVVCSRPIYYIVGVRKPVELELSVAQWLEWLATNELNQAQALNVQSKKRSYFRKRFFMQSRPYTCRICAYRNPGQRRRVTLWVATHPGKRSPSKRLKPILTGVQWEGLGGEDRGRTGQRLFANLARIGTDVRG